MTPGHLLPRAMLYCTCAGGVSSLVHEPGCAWGDAIGQSASHNKFKRCTCGAGSQGHCYIHLPSCEIVGKFKPPDPQGGSPTHFIMSAGVYEKRSNKVRPPRKVPDRSYKFTLQFYFARAINVDLWKKIKAPPGWRKCPISAKTQDNYRGVRFYCTDLKHALTPEEIEQLHCKLILSLKP